MSYGKQELSVADVAVRLDLSERHVVTLFNSGLLAGRQLRSGVWLTSETALERYCAVAQRGRGRALGATTAWGLLWELSGLRATWLSSSTLSRVRQQIVNLGPEEIVRAVAGRTRVHRFESPPEPLSFVASESLILTGLPGASSLRLLGDKRRVSAYVHGSIGKKAGQLGLIPDYDGLSALFEYNVPVSYDRVRMPAAVVAADLAVVGRDFERQRALQEISRLQRAWMDAR